MKANQRAVKMLSDTELVDLAKNGDASAFAELSDRYMPILHKRASRYAGLVGVEVEDFVQEGMFALFRAVKGYDPSTANQFSTYAVSCIHNSMTDAVRTHMRNVKRYTHVRIDDLDENQYYEPLPMQGQSKPVEDYLIEQELTSIRAHQIETLLSDFEQQVLKLYLGGHTYQQISEILSTATKSVDNALQRVRRKLRPRGSEPRDSH